MTKHIDFVCCASELGFQENRYYVSATITIITIAIIITIMITIARGRNIKNTRPAYQ